jgi:hypothetical protein
LIIGLFDVWWRNGHVELRPRSYAASAMTGGRIFFVSTEFRASMPLGGAQRV